MRADPTKDEVDRSNVQDWKQLIVEELRRSPLAVIFAGLSAAVGILALFTAARTGGASFPGPALERAAGAPSYLLLIAAYLGITTLAALMSRLLYVVSKVSAFFASLLLAVLSTFLTALVSRSQGVRFTTIGDAAQDQTAWVLFWGTVILFLVINGERVGMDLGRSIVEPSTDNGTEMDGGHVAVGLCFALCLWCTLVWWGVQFLAVPLFAGSN
jgi:hypothetical protein